MSECEECRLVETVARKSDGMEGNRTEEAVWLQVLCVSKGIFTKAVS